MQTTGKRLAKNTMFMYARMGILMLISLYTSRVVLQQLGVADYGTYNLVGTIVAMFTALRTLFSNSTQRYINYEMGKGNDERLKLVFNMGITINIIIALIFLFVAEAVGYWFLNYKMVIDPSRFYAAKVVFQFSVASAVISMITTPFDALIIAHERMDFFAFFAIFEGILRLGIVFMLSYFSFDKLIFYGFLQLIVGLIVMLSIALFCRKNFQECRIRILFDKSLFKEMAVFAGWNFLGNTVYSLVQNGLNMILNVFCGVTANAARGIAYQVNNAISQVFNSTTTVLNPFSTKTYACGQIRKMLDIMYFSTKIYFVIQATIIVPLCILSYQVLSIWLGQVPEYSVGFLQLVLAYSLIRFAHAPIDIFFKSAGRLKYYQIAEIIIMSIPLLASYLLLKKDVTPYSVFASVIFFEFINYAVIIYIANKQLDLPLREYLRNAIFPCCIALVFAVIGFVISLFYKDKILSLILIATLTTVIVDVFMFFVGFSKKERSQILALIHKKK